MNLAPATLKAYRTGTNRCIYFCVLYNIINPYPLTEDVLSHFVAFLYKEGLRQGPLRATWQQLNTHNFVRSGESPHGRHEQTGIRDTEGEKAYRGPDSHQASDHPPTACAAAKCMAREPVSEGCLDVVGSSYDVLFWFLEDRRGCWPV